jgi:hypothetical protein
VRIPTEVVGARLMYVYLRLHACKYYSVVPVEFSDATGCIQGISIDVLQAVPQNVIVKIGQENTTTHF